MDGDTAARVHPAFLSVLRQLTPDEVRIVSHSSTMAPTRSSPSAPATGSASGWGPSCATSACWPPQAGCEHPERVPLYIDNLCRLGLAELRPVRVADDTRSFRALEAAPEVKAAIARIEARIPELESAAAERRRQPRAWRTCSAGALRDRIRPPVLRSVRVPPRARAVSRRGMRIVMEAGPPPSSPTLHSAPRRAEREPLSLGEIRDIWPLLAHADRIEAFLLLPRDEAEDFFFALPARDQADVVMGVPAREQRSWVRSLPPDDAADVIQAAPPTKREALLALLDDADPARGDGAARLLRGQRRRPDEPALRRALRPDMTVDEAISYVRKQMREQPRDHLLRVRARRRAAAAGRGVVPRAVHGAGATARRRHHAATQVITVPEEMDQEAVSHKFAQSHLVALPVVDAGGPHEGHRHRRRRRRRRAGRGHRGHAEGRRRRGPRRALPADRACRG